MIGLVNNTGKERNGNEQFVLTFFLRNFMVYQIKYFDTSGEINVLFKSKMNCGNLFSS